MSVDTDENIVAVGAPSTYGQRNATIQTYYQFDHLISTVSVGGPQRALFLEEGMQWKPAWSLEDQLALSSYHGIVYSKVVLQFPQKFWDNKQFYLVGATNPGDVVFFQSLDTTAGQFLPGSAILFGTLLSPQSDEASFLPDQFLLDNLMNQLRKIWGPAIPNPVNVSFPQFRNNPFLRMSYSNVPVDQNLGGRFEALFRKRGPSNRFYLSGEAYCRDLNGYVHAGFLAGQTSALEALASEGLTTLDPFDNDCWRAPAIKNGAGWGKKHSA